MNKALLEARKQFAGQKPKLSAGGFDNSPVPEGKYTCEIIKSEIVDRTDNATGLDVPKFVICLNVVTGDQKSKKLWPYPPSLTDLEGITRSATLLRIILGDNGAQSVPGTAKTSGEFELDVDKFLLTCESLASACVGKMVEAQAKNSKKMRDDGTPFQNIYINRALGLDEKGVNKDADPVGELPFEKGKKTVVKKQVVAKKKVAKKKKG